MIPAAHAAIHPDPAGYIPPAPLYPFSIGGTSNGEGVQSKHIFALSREGF